eukprot:scaffold45817_cov50-Cyclotella_meneghiniana.AAC.1
MKGSHFIVNIGGGGTKTIFQGLDDEFATKIHGSGYHYSLFTYLNKTCFPSGFHQQYLCLSASIINLCHVLGNKDIFEAMEASPSLYFYERESVVGDESVEEVTNKLRSSLSWDKHYITARMSKMGKDGVAALKKKYGDDAMSKLGKDGVAALKKKYGDDVMSKKGKHMVATLKKKDGDDAMIKKGNHMVATLKKKYGDDAMRKMGKSNMAARVKKHGHDADGKSITHSKMGKAVAKKYGRNANGKSIAHSRKGKESWADRGIEVRKEALKKFDKTLTVVCGKCKEIIERERPLTMCYRENGKSRRITCSCVDNESHTDWTVQGQAANQAWKKVDGVWKQYTKREYKKRS